MIGAGMASRPWLDALSESGCDVVTVATRRPERLEAVKQRFPRVRRCWPPEAALDAEEVTLCLLLSPATKHLEGVRLAARAGIPVIVEKPLEVTFDKGVEAIQVARLAGVPLAVSFQYRYQEGARALKQAIEEGTLGELRAATLEVMWWRSDAYYAQDGRGTYERDGGGVLLTQAAHALDLLHWYLGTPSWAFARMVHGAFHDIETEDFATGIFAYPEGHVATVIATAGARSAEEVRIRVLGTQLTAVLTGNSLELFDNDGRVSHHDTRPSGETKSAADPMSFPSRWHTSFLAETLSAIESGAPLPISGEDALGSLALIDAFERSADAGQEVAPRTYGAGQRSSMSQ